MTVTEDVKARIDIVDLVGESVTLRKAGRTFKALCPFHAEKTPSFVVDPQRGTWHCFGACSEGGDAFSWIMKRDNVDFRDALQQLADRAGVQLRQLDPREQEREQFQKRLLAANDAAAVFFRRYLQEAPEAAAARDYLEQRGVSEEAAESFELGVAPDDGDALHRYLSGRGYRGEELEAAGLVLATERGIVDRFRSRLMFPIRDPRGACVGFGGRTLTDDSAKYVNTPQTDLFDKSGILYGFSRARPSLREVDRVIVVEGYMDVIAAHQYGDAAVVASMGTALTERQVALIKPLTRNILLALDADAAGAAATLRGIETARDAVGSEGRPVLNVRGLVRMQDELSADIRIIELPPDRDPDDLIRLDPDEWRRLVAEAAPFLDYRFDRARAEHDLETPRGRSRLVEDLLPLVASITDPVIRSEYVQRLASLTRVELETLSRQITGGRRGRPAAGRSLPAADAGGAVAPREKLLQFLLALAVARSEAADELDETILTLCDDAGAAAIFQARMAGDAEGWDADLPEPLPEEVDRLRAFARSFPPFTEEEARAAARDAAERLRRRRLREALRAQGQTIAEEEQRYERARLALAADALRGGAQTEIDPAEIEPELRDAANLILETQRRASSLHPSQPVPAGDPAPKESDV